MYDGKLYLSYKGSGSDDIWYNVFDGANWLAQDLEVSRDGHVKTGRAPLSQPSASTCLWPIATTAESADDSARPRARSETPHAWMDLPRRFGWPGYGRSGEG